MAKSVAFINEKGGIGKTSSCFNIAWELSKRKRILMLDMDGQRANLTYFCGIQKTSDMLTIYDVTAKEKNIHEVIVNVKENLDLVPANVEVTNLDQKAKISRLRTALKTVAEEYDYIFVDVSPSPNYSQYLTLSVVNYAVIPMLPEMSSIEAVNGIIESILEVKDSTNPNLSVVGLLFDRYNPRTKLSKFVSTASEKLANILDSEVFYATIRNAVSMGELSAQHVGITDYDPKSAVADDVRKVAKELEKKLN